MTFLKLFELYIREEGLVILSARKNCITFSKLPPPRQRYYRIRLVGDNLELLGVEMDTKNDKGSRFYIPHKRILLSVDIHDPKGTEAILNWIKEYRSKLN